MLSRELVRLMLDKRAKGLPPEMQEKSRLHIVDTLGISLAAARGSPVAAKVLASLCFGGASGDCRVIGHAQRLPPASAAMANASLAHTMDFDDIADVARVHPTAVTLSAALAAAEISGAKGTALIEAVCLGNELTCRLGLVLKALGSGPGADWFLSQLFGYLGGCFAAGLVLGLSEEEHVAALGLAYMQLAGSKEPAFGVGANSRSIYTGFAAMGGVQAALLAKAGMVGPDSALDGKAGMFPLYLGIRPAQEKIDALLAPDGWVWNEAGMKPWPCCRSSHPYVSVALGLNKRVDPTRISRVVADVTEAGARLCRPLEHRRRPKTLPDAKYSIPYMIAFALGKGRVDLQTLNEKSLLERETTRLAEKVDIAETLTDRPGPAPARITLHLDDGSQVVGELSEGLLLSVEEIRAKFLSCLTYVGFGERATVAWQRLEGLADMELDALFEVLDPAPAPARMRFERPGSPTAARPGSPSPRVRRPASQGPAR